MDKLHTRYHHQLKASKYDFIEVDEGEDGRITIKFLDTRWRTKEETIALFKEIIQELSTL